MTQALGLATPGNPDDFTVRYAYDGEGRLETLTNARGQILHSFYFAWGGLEMVVYDLDGDGVEPGEREVSYTYDLNGNVESASDTLLSGALPPIGQLYTFGYDERNRVKDATAYFIKGLPQLHSTYDRFGDRDSLALNPAGENLLHQWNFDALGRLAAVCMPQNQQVPTVPCVPGGSTETLAMSHFANDDLDTLTHGNGLVTAFAYYPEGPIQSISVGSAPLHRLAYTVDDVLNVDTITETIEGAVKSPAYDYGYDAVNRLTSATYPSGLGLPSGSPGETFGYDAAGNRDDDPVVATPWNYDANNRLVASPGSALSCYDDDGNLTSRRSAGDCTSGTVTETFTWDATNRLVGYGNAVTGATATYTYDPFGRRIKKTVNGVTRWYVWDGDKLLAEYDGSGTRALRYAYAGGFAPAQVAYRTGPGTEAIYDVHSDHLDTPNLLTNASGGVAWRAAHEAFGKAALDGGNDVTFNVRFPGQYYDAETGLYYNMHRYYSPELGRYLNADLIGQLGGVNLYTYAQNSPLNQSDAYGLLGGVDDAVFIVGGALLGLGSQFIADSRSGSDYTWQSYASAAIGGVAFGETLLNTGGNAYLAGLSAGAVTDLLYQGFNLASSKQCRFNAGQFGLSAGLGLALGAIPGASWEGVTAGRGSMLAVARQMTTKLANGQIGGVTLRTAAKMAAGFGVDAAAVEGAVLGGVVNAAIASSSSTQKSCDDSCP